MKVFKFLENSSFLDSSTKMKLTVATILFALILIGAKAAPTSNFDLGGMKGMVEAMSIVDGEKVAADPEMLAKVGDLLKGLIHKHLEKKKMSKKSVRKEIAEPVKTEVVQPEQEVIVPAESEKSPAVVAQPQQIKLVSSVNWDDHVESRDLINKRVPGGTEAVDALVKLIQEQRAQK